MVPEGEDLRGWGGVKAGAQPIWQREEMGSALPESARGSWPTTLACRLQALNMEAALFSFLAHDVESLLDLVI